MYRCRARRRIAAPRRRGPAAALRRSSRPDALPAEAPESAKLARNLLIPSGTQRGKRESVGRGGTGLATCALREPGVGCRGTSDPFFLPVVPFARDADAFDGPSPRPQSIADAKKTARCAVFLCQVPTPDGERNRGDPEFPAGVGDSYRDTSDCDAAGQSVVSLRPIPARCKRFQGSGSRRDSRSGRSNRPAGGSIRGRGGGATGSCRGGGGGRCARSPPCAGCDIVNGVRRGPSALPRGGVSRGCTGCIGCGVAMRRPGKRSSGGRQGPFSRS